MESSGTQTEAPLLDSELSPDLPPVPSRRNEKGELVVDEMVMQRSNYHPPHWPQPQPPKDIVTFTRGEYSLELQTMYERKARRGEINHAFNLTELREREMGAWEKEWELKNPPNDSMLARVAKHLYQGRKWEDAARLAAQEAMMDEEKARIRLDAVEERSALPAKPRGRPRKS